MATAHDVAAYILHKQGKMTAMKLQKLVYYAQAWSLVWDDRPLFKNRIEAWAMGPVVPDLYKVHRGAFVVNHWPKGDRGNLTESQRDTIDVVLDFYGKKSSQWLSDQTHQESPWRNARSGFPPGAPCGNEITLSDMAEYYGGL
jgi:uncharacterized phage-associated protein